jgi:hypothetical protein
MASTSTVELPAKDAADSRRWFALALIVVAQFMVVLDVAIFISAFAGHPPTRALAITAWACLVPVGAAFALIFRLPMHARERGTLG